MISSSYSGTDRSDPVRRHLERFPRPRSEGQVRHPKTFAVALTGTALSNRDEFTSYRFRSQVGLVAGLREDGTVRVSWPGLGVVTVEPREDLEAA